MLYFGMFIELDEENKTVTIRENVGENEDDIVIEIEGSDEEE